MDVWSFSAFEYLTSSAILPPNSGFIILRLSLSRYLTAGISNSFHSSSVWTLVSPSLLLSSISLLLSRIKYRFLVGNYKASRFSELLYLRQVLSSFIWKVSLLLCFQDWLEDKKERKPCFVCFSLVLSTIYDFAQQMIDWSHTVQPFINPSLQGIVQLV